jgi:hypothetical protein
MKKIFIIGLTIFIWVSFSTVIPLQVSQAGKFNPSLGTGFRCGNLLMREGLQKAQVVYNCGEPFLSEKSYVDALCRQVDRNRGSQTVITGKSFCRCSMPSA